MLVKFALGWQVLSINHSRSLEEAFPAAAEAATDYANFAARLKSYPFRSLPGPEFSVDIPDGAEPRHHIPDGAEPRHHTGTFFRRTARASLAAVQQASRMPGSGWVLIRIHQPCDQYR
jgi:hypothetical protein